MPRKKKTTKSSAPNRKIQQQEIIQCGSDVSYFLKRYVRIPHPKKGLVKFKTFPFQDDCLAEFQKHRYIIVNKSRQLGLSTSAAAYSLWLALFRREKNVLVVATKLSTAQNFIKKVRTMLKSLPGWLIMPSLVEDNKASLSFSNGSTIKAVPCSEDAGRSEALSLLIVDEAAHIEGIDKMWTAMQPTLSCVAGDTLVLTDEGFIPIEEFHKNKAVGDCFDLDIPVYGKNGMEKTSHGYVSPNHETYIITTKHGHKVECTPIHPLYSLQKSGLGDMIQAQNLKIGNNLRIEVGQGCFGKTNLDPDLAYMLGGFQETTPKNILRGTKQVVCSYLSGLFDSAGSITSSGVALSSTSKKLVEETSLLMHNLGFVTSIHSSKSLLNLQDFWKLVVPRSQYNKFATTIGLKTKRKQETLEKLSNMCAQNEHKLFPIPMEFVESKLRKLVERSSQTKKWFRENGVRLDKCLDGKPGRKTNSAWLLKFKTLLEQKTSIVLNQEDKRFFNEHIGSFYWDEIVKIEKGHNKTYDFTVPGTHSFLQNGILGSNTGGSVIMISSPSGVGTLFHRIWVNAQKGENEFHSIELPWTVHPERDEAWFQRERRALIESEGERGVAQELLCLDGSTNIITSDGCKKIKNIKLGEKVLTHKGRFRRVVRLYQHKLEPKESLYDVSTPGNRKKHIRITGNHPIQNYTFKIPKGKNCKERFHSLVNSGEITDKFTALQDLETWKFATNPTRRLVYGCLFPQVSSKNILTEQLSNIDLFDLPVKEKTVYKESFVRYPKQKKNKNTKRHVAVDFDLGRFIGLCAAEGHIEPNRFGLAFHHAEMETLGKFTRNYLDKLGANYYCNKRNYSKCYTILSTNKFIRELIRYFIVDGNARTKHYSNNIYKTNLEFIKGLVVGHFEGDGDHPINHNLDNKIKVVCKSEKMLYQLRTLLSLHGHYPRIGYWNQEPSYLEIDGLLNLKPKNRHIRTLLQPGCSKDTLSKPTSRTTSVEGKHFVGAFQWNKVNVDDEYEERPVVYNIEVEEDNSYVADSLVVHNCSFMSSGDTFLKGDAMDALFNHVKPPIEKTQHGRYETWIWAHPQPGHKYIISADVARGDGADYSAFHIIDVDAEQIVADFRGKPAPDAFADIMIDYAKKYNTALICQELNNVGVACAQKLKSSGYSNLYYEKFQKNIYMTYVNQDIGPTDYPGFTTTSNSREQILAKLENAIRNGHLHLHSKRLYEELQTFIWKGNKPMAQKGHHDDLVMALAIGCQLFEFSGKNQYSNSESQWALLRGMSRNQQQMNTTTGQTSDGFFSTPGKKNQGQQGVKSQIEREMEKTKIKSLAPSKTHNYNDPAWDHIKWIFDD